MLFSCLLVRNQRLDRHIGLGIGRMILRVLVVMPVDGASRDPRWCKSRSAMHNWDLIIDRDPARSK
jgi:hypothetical protein